jgi:hypothetical protein
MAYLWLYEWATLRGDVLLDLQPGANPGKGKTMTNQEIISDKRFKLAIQKGEYTRAISLFLRLKFPNVEHLEKLPKDEISTAQVFVDNAFHEKHMREKSMDKEMR